jgi:hypothetical protein
MSFPRKRESRAHSHAPQQSSFPEAGDYLLIFHRLSTHVAVCREQLLRYRGGNMLSSPDFPQGYTPDYTVNIPSREHCRVVGIGEGWYNQE